MPRGIKKGKKEIKAIACSAKRKQQHTSQDAKKVSFTACHSGKLLLARPSPKNQSWREKKHLDEHWLQFFCNWNSPKKFICPSGTLRIEIASPTAKFTSPGLSDTTFIARCIIHQSTSCKKQNDIALTHSPLSRRNRPWGSTSLLLLVMSSGFNGQEQLCPLTCAEWRDLLNHTRKENIEDRKKLLGSNF